MRQAAISFTSKGLTLEGIISTPEGLPAPYPAVVVCHPHPRLGGDMHNAVVLAVCRAADGRGMATLRFNFRGVGESEGQPGDGRGEQEDVRAALDVLRRWPGMDRGRLALAGYSFGASVVLGGIQGYRAARCLVFIAPPLSAVRESRVKGDKRPKLFVVGSNDRIAPSQELQRAIDEMAQPVQFREVLGADHSLRGHEDAVAEQVAEFLEGTLMA